MNRDTNPLVRLATSSKAIVVLALVTVAVVAFFTGRITWAEASTFVEWLVAPWLLAQGAEDAAKHLAAGRTVTALSDKSQSDKPDKPQAISVDVDVGSSGNGK